MPKLVCGVGYNDADYKINPIINGKHVMCPFYKTWQSMLARCYSKAFQDKKPTYKGCYVCSEWLTFSKFKSWMEKQDWKGKQLDKDILYKGNKEYSPERCVFVDGRVNSFINDKPASRGLTLLGVNYHSRDKVYQARCSNPLENKSDYLGYFDNEADAHEAWRRRKHYFATKLAETITDARISEALIKRYKKGA